MRSATIVLVVALGGFLIGSMLAGGDSEVVVNGPTPIPRGPLLLEINFAAAGEGACNDYDRSKMGYEGQQYYIVAPTSGFMAVCHANDFLAPEGSLQVAARPEGDPATYGFGVLFGWGGGEEKPTMDACMIGIRRKGGESGSYTEALFRERVNGEEEHFDQRLDSVELDNGTHTLRVTMRPDGRAMSYLDERYLAEHRFSHCGQGPVGMVAYASGNKKVYFDDLKLFGLP